MKPAVFPNGIPFKTFIGHLLFQPEFLLKTKNDQIQLNRPEFGLEKSRRLQNALRIHIRAMVEYADGIKTLQ